MKSFRFVCYFLIFGLNTNLCFCLGQDSLTARKIINCSLSYHHGYLFPHHRLVTYFTGEYINGFDLALSRYMPELKPDNPPEMGIGYYCSNLGNMDIYGYTHGLYLYASRDFFRNKSPFSFYQVIGMGTSYNTKHYSISENYSNRLIGSHLNIFFLYSLGIKINIHDKLLLSAGPAAVHTSNGNIRQPNFGLNLLNTRFSMTYLIDSKKKIKYPSPDMETGYNKNRFLMIIAGGVRQVSHRLPDYFTIGSLNADYTRRLKPNLALGLGMDLVYDPTEGMELYVTGAHIENIVPWHMGLHFSYERIWNHLSLVINPGYKIYTPSEHFNYQYNRVGVRYRLDNHLVLNYTLKSHRFVADFIEFGIGYIFE